MAILSPFKALRTLRKTPLILQTLLAGVEHAEAVARTDGPNGWNIVFILCHLRDYEVACIKRVNDMLTRDCPTFETWDNDELARKNEYDKQTFQIVLGDYLSLRRQFIALLEGVTDAQWARKGMNPQQGEGTVLDVAINAGLHDVDHIEQVTRCVKQ